MPINEPIIPRKDDKYFDYMLGGTAHLKKRFKEQLLVVVPKNSTVNLMSADWKDGIKITFEIAGGPGTPDAYVCITQEDTDACDTDSAVKVSIGAPQTVDVEQLGGEQRRHLQATNTDLAADTTLR